VQASKFMYADEVAAEFPVTAATLRYWASIGEGPKSWKVGRRRVWRRDGEGGVEDFFAGLEAAGP
jgi:prophage regulatory protein